MASTSIPSMPSVPLIRARPSFSRRMSGSMPAATSASRAGTILPVGIADVALADGRDGQVSKRCEIA